jgi:hypothetical protein
MYCSEFHQWQIHFNNDHDGLYSPYSFVPDSQNFLNFQKLWVVCVSRILLWLRRRNTIPKWGSNSDTMDPPVHSTTLKDTVRLIVHTYFQGIFRVSGTKKWVDQQTIQRNGMNHLGILWTWESFAWVRWTGFTDGILVMGSIPGAEHWWWKIWWGDIFGWVVDFFVGGAGGKRPPRTPRSSGYVVYAHAVYVVICYMSITCICLLYVVICYMSVIGYMSVICLLLGTSWYI